MVIVLQLKQKMVENKILPEEDKEVFLDKVYPPFIFVKFGKLHVINEVQS